VYQIKKKSDVFEVFKVYKALVELDFGKKIKCLRTDNRGEYTGDEFVAPQHEVNETNESQAPATHTFNHERKRPGWHSDYVMESNIAYCLLTEEGPNKDRINKLKAQLVREFEMKDLGPVNKIPGMQIHRDRMSPCSKDEKMSRVPYASAVGSLMFAMICTRPYIAHAVGVVSRYMAEPGREHWEAVKRIFRYIKETSYVALCFGESDFTVKGYVDSDYACELDRKAGYVATAQASKEAVWLKMLLEELGHEQEKIILFCNNQSAFYLAKNPSFHLRTKHIRVQYHFVREKVEEGTLDMQKIHTDDNVADYLTKAINGDKFIW
ncbi:hypothetical protein Tco_1364096, partial [Tanacetum coccineum]